MVTWSSFQSQLPTSRVYFFGRDNNKSHQPARRHKIRTENAQLQATKISAHAATVQ